MAWLPRGPSTSRCWSLPVLVDYERATWIAIHRRLSGLAAKRGFEVVDLLPGLATGRPDALSYRVASNDLHFNEAANEVVARRLAEQLR
jgi:lysophospholipase L1-like esterase